MSKQWKVYLAGEVHSDWRQQITKSAQDAELDVLFFAPVMDHGASDGCGVDILGPEDDAFWTDHKGGKINAIRTRTLIRASDLVVVKFGDDYRQWNAAFDAGYAFALDKSLIVLHPPELRHPLKEVDAAALAVASEPSQVVDILNYVMTAM